MVLDKINNLKTDYIVEQGTSGLWTYRKWNNGILELDILYSTGDINCNTAYGSVYHSGILTISLPSEMVKTLKTITNSCDLKSGIGGVCISSIALTDVQQIRYYVYHATARMSFSPIISWHVVGTWK